MISRPEVDPQVERFIPQLWSAVNPSMQDSVQQRGGGGADVQRVEVSAQREPHELVAARGHARVAGPSPPRRARGPPRRSSPAPGSGPPRAPRRPRSTRSRPSARHRGSRRGCARARRAATPARPPTPCTRTASPRPRAARGSRRRSPRRPSAVRQIAPRFCGSWTSSSATISGSGPREQVGGVHVRVAVGLRADALVLLAVGAVGDVGGRHDVDRNARPRAPRARAPATEAVAQISWTRRRRARSASWTALRP